MLRFSLGMLGAGQGLMFLAVSGAFTVHSNFLAALSSELLGAQMERCSTGAKMSLL